MPKSTTIGQYLRFLSPSIAQREEPPDWPPDVFGAVAALLLESGAYLRVFDDWPPRGRPAEGCLDSSPKQWARRMRAIGRTWRKTGPTKEVRSWWRVVLAARNLPLDRLRKAQQQADLKGLAACNALLHLMAAADEACFDAGASSPASNAPDLFWLEAYVRLLPRMKEGSTLAHEIDPSKLRVLPKFHTPQSGMTLRSLSHNLSLWTGSTVMPQWFSWELPWATKAKPKGGEHSLNLLLVPWPASVVPKDFSACEPSRGSIHNMDEGRFGFFTYERSPKPESHLRLLQAIFEEAKRYTDHIDGVILPELALTSTEYEAIRPWVMSRGSFLLAGVGVPAQRKVAGRNFVSIDLPLGWSSGEAPPESIRTQQDKHHRWRLDRAQVVQYGLGGRLDPARLWWEYAEASHRSLSFVSVLPWLSLCTLLCEDLAQQDPVAQLVRAVGPNLVVALLMDGPQLVGRWPARFATVLADDPGASVLSLTSIGMCELSRPPGKPVSRTIALWKDAKSREAIEIELPRDASAILLNLARHKEEEWTADGRPDGGAAGFPILAGIHPLKVKVEEADGGRV